MWLERPGSGRTLQTLKQLLGLLVSLLKAMGGRTLQTLEQLLGLLFIPQRIST